MQLTQFKSLIDQMPVRYQAFLSKRSTWAQFEQHEAVRDALGLLFGGDSDVFISREQLFAWGRLDDLSQFVVGTIIWGYPRGMRGNHFHNLLGHFPDLLRLLTEARDRGIADWASHFRAVKPIKGVGLSTYTKFLHFLQVKVQDVGALVLDDRIIEVARRCVFDDLACLSNLTMHKSVARYPEYLSLMHQLAFSLGLEPDALELFLFEFGLKLKHP